MTGYPNSEKELRRVIEMSRPISALKVARDLTDKEYHVMVTLKKNNNRYEMLLDIYFPTGTTGETIHEEGQLFTYFEEALNYLYTTYKIRLSDFKA